MCSSILVSSALAEPGHPLNTPLRKTHRLEKHHLGGRAFPHRKQNLEKTPIFSFFRVPDRDHSNLSFQTTCGPAIPKLDLRVFLNLWFAKPMVWVRVAFHENDGNHENDENDEDNSDSYKQGVECLIRGNHGNHENDENHGNPGCKPRVPQTIGLEIPEICSKISQISFDLFNCCLWHHLHCQDAKHFFAEFFRALTFGTLRLCKGNPRDPAILKKLRS